MVEHSLSMRGVTGSMPVISTHTSFFFFFSPSLSSPRPSPNLHVFSMEQLQKQLEDMVRRIISSSSMRTARLFCVYRTRALQLRRLARAPSTGFRARRGHCSVKRHRCARRAPHTAVVAVAALQPSDAATAHALAQAAVTWKVRCYGYAAQTLRTPPRALALLWKTRPSSASRQVRRCLRRAPRRRRRRHRLRRHCC